jgi:hypothetical protein
MNELNVFGLNSLKNRFNKVKNGFKTKNSRFQMLMKCSQVIKSIKISISSDKIYLISLEILF